MQIGFKGIIYKPYQNKALNNVEIKKDSRVYKTFTTWGGGHLIVSDDSKDRDLTELIKNNKENNESPGQTIFRLQYEISSGTKTGKEIVFQLLQKMEGKKSKEYKH